MASHGVRKVKTTADKIAERLARDKVEIEKLAQLMEQFKKNRDQKIYTSESLDNATKILSMCTEYYSVWNFRKRALIPIIGGSDDPQALFDSEMRFTDQGIARNPKSYWVWHHRKWLTVHAVKAVKKALEKKEEEKQETEEEKDSANTSTTRDVKVQWSRELKLCGKLLDLDQRNFHCWSYRRYVAEHGGVETTTDAKELEFTRTKIDQNFSNYSAWHQRSLLLSRIHKGPDLTKALKKEFELVQQAYYTEPEDQSAWIYHRWLIGTTRLNESQSVYSDTLRAELNNCEELLELEPESKWCLLTSVFLMEGLLLVSGDSSNAVKWRQLSTDRLSLLSQLDARHTKYYQRQKEIMKLQ